MKDRSAKEAARRAVEVLAGAAEVPAPPGDLGKIAGRRLLGPALYAAGAGLLAVTLIAGWLLRDGMPPAEEPPPAGVVIEHLRVGGRPVVARIVTPPGADAVVVITEVQRLNGAVPGAGRPEEAVIARGPDPGGKENLR